MRKPAVVAEAALFSCTRSTDRPLASAPIRYRWFELGSQRETSTAMSIDSSPSPRGARSTPTRLTAVRVDSLATNSNVCRASAHIYLREIRGLTPRLRCPERNANGPAARNPVQEGAFRPREIRFASTAGWNGRTRHGLDERHRCAYERLLTTLKLPYPLGDSLCDANMYGFKPSLRKAAPTRVVVRHRLPPILCAQTMKVVLTCAPPGLRAFSLRYVLLHATRVWLGKAPRESTRA